MSNLCSTLLRTSVADVTRLISRSGKIEQLRKREIAPVLATTSTENVDQVFDKVYPVMDYVEKTHQESIDLSDIMDKTIEPDVNIWLVVFMNGVVHSILEGVPIKVIKVPMDVDTTFLSVFIRCVQGANRIRHKESEEIRILPSGRKEV